MCIHTPIDTNIGTIRKNAEVLEFIPDHLETK